MTAGAIDLTGLLALIVAGSRRRAGWPVAGTIAFIGAADAPFIRNWRDHHPVYNMLVFAAAAGGSRRVTMARRRSHA